MRVSRIFSLVAVFLASTDGFRGKSSPVSCVVNRIAKTLSESHNDLAIINFSKDEDFLSSLKLNSLHENNVPHRSQTLQVHLKVPIGIKFSTVFIFDSVKTMSSFNDIAVLTNKYSRPIYIFMFCKEATIKEIEAIKDKSVILQFEYFVVEEGNFIRILTFVWYTEQKCDMAQLIEVNRFDKVTRTWQHDNIVIKKFQNFYKCKIVFGGAIKNPFFLHQHIVVAGKKMQYYSGLNCAIIKDSSKSLNYEISFNHLISNEHYYNRDLRIDLEIKSTSLAAAYSYTNIYEGGSAFITHPYLYGDELLAVPPGEEYTQFEKLVLPFDVITWALISLVFVVAFATIFLCNFIRQDWRDFLFGRNVTTESLNVTSIFFGVGQSAVPRRNFARFLVMVFLIYCLIIRTAYQGTMFVLMQKNIRKLGVQSIEEMIEKNFTFYLKANFNKDFKYSELIQR